MSPSVFEIEEQTQLVTRAAKAISYDDLRRARAWMADIVLQQPDSDAAETARFRGAVINGWIEELEKRGLRPARTNRTAWKGIMTITGFPAPGPLSPRSEIEGLARVVTLLAVVVFTIIAFAVLASLIEGR